MYSEVSIDPQIIIQKPTFEDIPQMIKIMESTFGQYSKHEEMCRMWISSDLHSIYIARKENQIIGLCTWAIKSNTDFSSYECFGSEAIAFMQNKKIVTILNLVVFPQYRRGKIGHRLAISHLPWLQKQNCEIVVGSSWVNGTSDHSQHLYIKAGFKKLGESNQFFRLQTQNQVVCTTCKTTDCKCNYFLFGIEVSDFLKNAADLKKQPLKDEWNQNNG